MLWESISVVKNTKFQHFRKFVYYRRNSTNFRKFRYFRRNFNIFKKCVIFCYFIHVIHNAQTILLWMNFPEYPSKVGSVKLTYIIFKSRLLSLYSNYKEWPNINNLVMKIEAEFTWENFNQEYFDFFNRLSGEGPSYK